MASFDQDLIVFEDDTMLIQYTFTDLAENFNSGYSVWWGACLTAQLDPTAGPTTTPPEPGPTTIVQKSINWTAGDATTPPNNGGITLLNNSATVRVYLLQSDFTSTDTVYTKLQTDEEYITQLVISDDTTENQSVTGAQGKFFISSSLFSAAGYRP